MKTITTRQIRCEGSADGNPSRSHTLTATYDRESPDKSGEGGPAAPNPRAGRSYRHANPLWQPLTKTEIAQQLTSLEPKIDTFVRRESDAGEIERDDLINSLEILLYHALELTPDDDEVVIRWTPDDICDAAAEMDLRLSREQARDLLQRIRSTVEEVSLAAGQDLIDKCLADLKREAGHHA